MRKGKSMRGTFTESTKGISGGGECRGGGTRGTRKKGKGERGKNWEL